MSEDDVHYESCGESNIIEAVYSINSTNEVANENVYDESSCDENDSFVRFDNMKEAEIVDDSSSDEQFDVEESVSPNNETLSSELALWYAENNISRTALGKLLVVLRKYGNFLPKDARTLLKTPSNISALRKCKVDFIYFGIEAGLLNLLSQNIELGSLICLEKIANIDGLPIFKSTGAQFWPILLNLNGLKFLVALYYGYQKPSHVEEYLEEFLNELAVLTREGVQIFGKQYEGNLKCFVCDAPARSYLKGIVNHTGCYSCERCTIKGEWASRVVLDELGEQEPRTDEKFQNYQYPQHQKFASPLINAGIKCIEQFPLDYMHMVCLGVVKRIVSFLKSGPGISKLSRQQLDVISEQLVSFNGLFLSEFSRQPRSLFESDRWKATEFRQFLLYTGPIVLKDFLQIV